MIETEIEPPAAADAKPVAWRWKGSNGETITPWRPDNVEAEGLHTADEVHKLREALQTAVDAIAFYLRPESLDGGAGECAAITNAVGAERIALAALQPSSAADAKPEADKAWREAVTNALNAAGMASPEFAWGGDKMGWGCAFEFIGALARGRFLSPLHEAQPHPSQQAGATGETGQ